MSAGCGGAAQTGLSGPQHSQETPGRAGNQGNSAVDEKRGVPAGNAGGDVVPGQPGLLLLAGLDGPQGSEGAGRAARHSLAFERTEHLDIRARGGGTGQHRGGLLVAAGRNGGKVGNLPHAAGDDGLEPAAGEHPAEQLLGLLEHHPRPLPSPLLQNGAGHQVHLLRALRGLPQL